MQPKLIQHQGCFYKIVEATPMISFQRCKSFKAKSRQEQKKQIEKCKHDGGTWVSARCFCNKKRQPGMK
jgi:hypothetical protein